MENRNRKHIKKARAAVAPGFANGAAKQTPNKQLYLGIMTESMT